MSIKPQSSQSYSGEAMSVEVYLQLDRNSPNAKYEYLDGVARLMSGGSVGHDRIARNTAHLIEEQFLSGPCTVFGSDVQVHIGVKPNGRDDYVYPDVTVSCDVADRRRGNTLIRSPRIVVEVLSPSTEHVDRGKKLEIYKGCATIQEIVLISQFERHVEVYRRDEEDRTVWKDLGYEGGSMLRLSSVDVRLAVNDLYKGIDFDEPLVEQ